MNNNWMNPRMIGLLFALPLIATAVASAQHMAAGSAPLVNDSVATANATDFTSNRVHAISLNRAGEVEGRIASFGGDNAQVEGLADLKIFFVRNGEIAQETKTTEDGTFTVDGLTEGIYSFVATGETGFAAYGVQVVPFDESSKMNVMEAAAVSPHFSVVKSILKKNLPTDVADEIISVSRNENVDRVVGGNRVRLDDGQLVGHVTPMLGDVSVVEGTQVHIIRDDQQVAQVEVGEQGSFMVPDLEPGVYDFVAAGPSGFAAVSFQAVDADAGVDIDAGEIGESVLADSDEIPVAIPAAAQGSGSASRSVGGAIPADIPFDSGIGDGGFYDGGFSSGGVVDGGFSDSLDVCLTCQQDAGFVGEQIEYAGCDTCGGEEVVYDSSPIEYASESLGCGCAAGGACGSCGDFTAASCCNSGGGSAGGGFGGLNFRRLGLLAAGIAIPIALATGDDDDDVTPVAASPATL